MAENIPAITLFLSNASVALGQTMDAEKLQPHGTDFENVELGKTGKKKIPRRIIHFASGETMEEYSTDEEQEEQEKKDLLPAVDPTRLTWGPYLWFYMIRVATTTLSVCDFLGEKMASLFGISTPKYQYAIDEYYRMKKEEEEEEHEDRMSEEAERQYQEQLKKRQEMSGVQTGQPEAGTSFVNHLHSFPGSQSASVDQEAWIRGRNQLQSPTSVAPKTGTAKIPHGHSSLSMDCLRRIILTQREVQISPLLFPDKEHSMMP